MGASADSIVAYAQPLLDSGDGSIEYVQEALTYAELCWNLALMPEDAREEPLRKMQPTLGLNDQELEAFREEILEPMIRRHQEMFPRLHERAPGPDLGEVPGPREAPTHPEPPAPAPPVTRPAGRNKRYAGTARNAACPCGSGLKYKRCHGQ